MAPTPPTSSKSLSRQVLQVIVGPWPIRPILSLVVLFIANLYARNVFIDINPSNFTNRYPSALPFAFTVAVTVGAVLWVGRTIESRVTGGRPSRLAYLLTMVVAGMVFGVMTFVARPSFDVSDPDFRGILFYLLRSLIMIMFIHTIAGVNDARLRAQITRAEDAVRELREQRHVVVDAEERARTSVARFLHDRVQAGLVAISLHLRAISERVPEPTRGELGSIVEALEDVRSIDVRAASRRLSPDIATTGLPDAIMELLSGYSDSMAVDLSVEESVRSHIVSGEVDDRMALAVYRVVEQAMLNAAVHGRAQRVLVTLTLRDGQLSLHVEDDGLGLPADGGTPGSGSRIMSAWVAMLDGSWSLAPGPNGGTVLAAAIPLP